MLAFSANYTCESRYSYSFESLPILTMQSWVTASKSYSYNVQYPVCLATGTDGKCALVSRNAIALTRQGDVRGIERTIKRDSKWDPTYAEFSRLQPNLLALTNAQKVLIYNVSETKTSKELFMLQGHTRNITDFSWSVNDANLLASVSLDHFTHIYDLRFNK